MYVLLRCLFRLFLFSGTLWWLQQRREPDTADVTEDAFGNERRKKAG